MKGCQISKRPECLVKKFGLVFEYQEADHIINWEREELKPR